MTTDQPDAAMLTLDEFLRTHGLSRSTWYNLVKRGQNPDFVKLGRRKVLIPAEAARRWREGLRTATPN